MIEIGNTLVGNEVIKTEFVCNLSKCKGACCIAGDLGAPLEEEERHTLDDIFPLIRPYLNEKGLKALEEQGAYVLDDQGDYSTPLVDGKECAYVVFEKNGTLKCAIEQAHSDGKTDFKKPLACHLYPIMLTSLIDITEVNYDVWEICSDACTLGQELHIPVYKFLKEPLIRKFGEEWWNTLDKIAIEKKEA